MKVITEEDFIKLVQSGYIDIIKGSSDEYLKEIDTLTVRQLRPMCDAPKDGLSILCVLFGSNKLREMFFDDGSWVLEGTETLYNDEHIKGWIPMPTYQPELTLDGE